MKLTVGEKRPSDVQLVELTEEADMNLSSGTKVGDGRQPPAHLNGRQLPTHQGGERRPSRRVGRSATGGRCGHGGKRMRAARWSIGEQRRSNPWRRRHARHLCPSPTPNGEREKGRDVAEGTSTAWRGCGWPQSASTGEGQAGCEAATSS